MLPNGAVNNDTSLWGGGLQRNLDEVPRVGISPRPVAWAGVWCLLLRCASWECQGHNPGKLAHLPSLVLVTRAEALMGCLLLALSWALVGMVLSSWEASKPSQGNLQVCLSWFWSSSPLFTCISLSFYVPTSMHLCRTETVETFVAYTYRC